MPSAAHAVAATGPRAGAVEVHVAVSGSSGFIGTRLVQELKAGGDQVHPIVRRTPGPGEIGLDLEHHRLDCSEMANGRLDSVDLIYHLSGEPLTPRRWTGAKREAIRSSRITSTDVIARAIATADCPPPVFVTMSAVGYYGSRGPEILDETATSGSGFLAELCRAWELAAAPAKAVGSRVVHARSGIVVSEHGGLVKRLAPFFRTGLGATLGDGRQWMSTVSLADEVRALRFLGTSPAMVGPCNVTSPNPITNADFTRALGRHFGRTAPFSIPVIALRLALGNVAADDLALASQRVVPSRLEAEGFVFDHPDVEDALEAG